MLAVTEPLAGPRSISADGTTAFAAVQFDSSTAELGREALDELFASEEAAEAAGGAGGVRR